jgi:hypothetical protein
VAQATHFALVAAPRAVLRLLPLADQAGGHVERARENCPAGVLPQTKGTDFFGLQSVHGRRQAESVEFARGALVHYARGAESLGGLVDGEEGRCFGQPANVTIAPEGRLQP